MVLRFDCFLTYSLRMEYAVISLLLGLYGTVSNPFFFSTTIKALSSYITRSLGWRSSTLPRPCKILIISPAFSGVSWRVWMPEFTVTRRWLSNCLTLVRVMPPNLERRNGINSVAASTRKDVSCFRFILSFS